MDEITRTTLYFFAMMAKALQGKQGDDVSNANANRIKALIGEVAPAKVAPAKRQRHTIDLTRIGVEGLQRVSGECKLSHVDLAGMIKVCEATKAPWMLPVLEALSAQGWLPLFTVRYEAYHSQHSFKMEIRERLREDPVEDAKLVFSSQYGDECAYAQYGVVDEDGLFVEDSPALLITNQPSQLVYFLKSSPFRAFHAQ